MESSVKIVKVTLANGTPIYIQAKTFGSEEDIALKLPKFEQVTKAIEGVAESLSAAWDKAKPSKASVEFGVEFVWESGEVLAIFVDGSTTASMKITLEWSGSSSQ